MSGGRPPRDRRIIISAMIERESVPLMDAIIFVVLIFIKNRNKNKVADVRA